MSQKLIEIFNRIATAKKEAELDGALADIDTLDTQDQREIVDMLEKEITASMVAENRINEVLALALALPQNDSSGWWGPDGEEVKTYLRFLMKGFNKIAAIKGDEASDLSKNMAAGYTSLSESQKNDLYSLAETGLKILEKGGLKGPKR